MINPNKKHTISEGFGMNNLLSSTEIGVIRAIARNYKIDIDKAEFDKAKADFRAIEVVDDSFARNYIHNMSSIIVLSKEELESIARGDD